MAIDDLTHGQQATTVPQRFALIVQHYGAQPALIEGSAHLTYAELDAAANRIARAIHDTAGSNAPVVVLLAHGSAQISAILGVLKAGRAYSALDPSFPLERSALILDALQSELLITDSAHLAQAQQLAAGGCRVLNVDSFDEATPALPPQGTVSPDAVAAVFFTSGTTGAPKGVMRTQHEIVLMTLARVLVEPCAADDVVSMLYSGSFSASMADLFVALLHGAALCIYDLRQAGVDGLAEWICTHGVTRLHLHAPVLRQLLDGLRADASFPSLRYVRPSDRLYRNDVERLWRHLPANATVFHGLASTEAGMITRLKLQHGELPPGEIVPVGAPVPGAEIRLVDASGQPTPPDHAGELIVSTPHLTSGYWRNPELTAEKFFVDPVANRRCYRLGDLARWRPDGLLELAGRKDFQVKIRGYRVELGEVEAALEQLDSVRQSMVVADADAGGELRLVAYVAPMEPAHFALSELRRALAARLPGFMVPAAYVVMERLPSLSNGKVDRRALPSLSTARPAVDGPYVAPRTPVEQTLAAIWADVLGFERVGVQDDFLELGGHSLQAARLISRVVRTFQVDLSLRALFDAPTVAAMSLAVTQQQAARIDQDEVERLLKELETMPSAFQTEGTQR